jgi:biopolymer transport protein ExbD
MPISLSEGHFKTAEFKINLEGAYELYIELQPVFGDGSGAGLHCPNPPPRTAWSLSKGGRVVANGTAGGGFFHADAGRYALDFDVRDDDGSCLNAGSPRLIIAAFRYEHPEVNDKLTGAFFLSFLLAATGINLFVHSRRARRNQEPVYSLTEMGPQPPLAGVGSGSPRAAAKPTGEAHTASSAVAIEYGRARLRRASVWPFQKPSGFGLLASLICSLLFMCVCVVESTRFVPTGLVVHLLKPEVATKAQAGVEPLLVRVEFNGRSVIRNLYIGSQRIPSEVFDTTLLKGLASRPPTWPVYVEGDPNLDWGTVAKVVDEIRGLHAKVVMLTRPRR